MADRSPDADAPRVQRIAGPLEGYRLGAADVPVRIFDLTPPRLSRGIERRHAAAATVSACRLTCPARAGRSSTCDNAPHRGSQRRRRELHPAGRGHPQPHRAGDRAPVRLAGGGRRNGHRWGGQRRLTRSFLRTGRVPNSAVSIRQASRRSELRVAGPFEARRVGPLPTPPCASTTCSTGGCLVECYYDVASGRRITLQIDLPGEGWITVEAETLDLRDNVGIRMYGSPSSATPTAAESNGRSSGCSWTDCAARAAGWTFGAMQCKRSG